MVALVLALYPSYLGQAEPQESPVALTAETNFDPANVLPLAGLGGGIPSSDIKSEVLLPCGGDAFQTDECEPTN